MEMHRVMRPGGVLFLKIHHARFYFAEFRQGLRSRNLRSAAHAVRVLIAGACYLLTGRQPRNRVVGGETFQTEGLLRREIARCGLLLLHDRLPDSTPSTPAFVMVSAPETKNGFAKDVTKTGR
jgi:hypothetical protein